MLGICMALIDDEEDKKAFERLVNKYERKLYRESIRILKEKRLAEEAVWETFYKIAENFQKVNNLPVYKMEAYLIITIRNASYGIYNIEKKHLSDYTCDKINEIPDDEKFNDFEVDDLANAINGLEEKYKTVVTYYYYYGHSAKEISTIMGVSKNTVYSYLRKAKKLLFEELRGDIDE